ncbi:MAG: efflux RND transporter permease subunit, partial [Gammaproteobacteria bacterium]|nr:efflux RND transporter permease subunit [Gammaproteobacteria bacterium]
FTQPFLKKLKTLHKELEDNVPYLDEVNSLINARNTRGVGDSLIVEDLFEDWPETQQAMDKKKQLTLSNKLYRNLYISEDAKYTTVVISSVAYSPVGNEANIETGFDDPTTETTASQEPVFLTDAENSEMVKKIESIANKYKADDFVIYTAGSPVVVDAIKKSMQKDMQTSTKFALLSIALVLLILFRRISGVLLPVIVVILTLLSTFSFMAATGTPLKLPTQILPSFLLAVGVAASVHLLSIFYGHFNNNGNKKNAIGYALGHSGLAIAMTSLTTAASLLSFSMSEVAPIADLGKFAAAGVMVSLLYTLILLPALIALIPLKQKQDASTQNRTKFMDSILLKFSHISTNYSKLIISISAVLFLVAVFGLLKITFYHDPLKWMPETWETRQATELLDVEMKGTGVIEVVIDTGKENGLYDPKVVAAIDKLHGKIDKLTIDEIFVGKTMSLIDVLKESNRALHENKEEFYTPPLNRDLIAQELLLFENSGSDDLEDLVDSQFSKARFTIKTPWMDAARNTLLIHEIEKEFNDTMGDLATTSATGMGSLFGRTMDAAINSTKISYIAAAGVITIMMILLLGSAKLGVISMIPNLLPIIISLGVMGYFSMPLDMFTMLIGSIAIGLVVDDTIHFLHNFKRYFLQYNDVNKAVEETLLSTGRAIFVTTIVLCIGFFIFMTADMNNVFRFGLITGTTIILALLSDLLLAPALMKVIYENKKTQTA